MSEDRDTRMPEENPQPGNAGRIKQLVAHLSGALGTLFAAGGLATALLGEGASISAGVVGAVLGILGYFLGSRRLGTVTIILSVLALFFGLAASQGLIPGVEPTGRELAAVAD